MFSSVSSLRRRLRSAAAIAAVATLLAAVGLPADPAYAAEPSRPAVKVQAEKPHPAASSAAMPKSAPRGHAEDGPAVALTVEFNDSSIDDHDWTNIKIHLVRTDASSDSTGLGFRINLPTDLEVADDGHGITCDGTVAASEGASTIELSGATIPTATLNCEITVPVTSAKSGTYVIGDGAVDNLAGGVTNDLTQQTLEVTASDPRLSAAFKPSTIPALDTADLRLQLERSDENPTSSATGLGFVITLPDHVVVAPKGVHTNDCGGTATAVAGASTLSLSGVTLTVDNGCVLIVVVTSARASTYPLSNSSITSHTGIYPSLRSGCKGDVGAASEGCTPKLTVTALPQAITFDPPATLDATAGPLALTATAGSKLPVTFSAGPADVCEVSGGTLTPKGAGACHVTADQTGDATYAPAPTVTRDVVVASAAPGAPTLTAGLGKLTATWKAPADPTGVTGFRVTASPGPQTCETTGATVTTCDLDGTPGTAYTVTVVALRATGASPASPASNPATPTAPPAPGAPTLTAGISSLTATWKPPADTKGVTGYRVTASPGPATCTTSGETTCVLGGTAGTTYTVTVVALAGGGSSAASGASNPATPTAPEQPAAPPATDLVLTTDQGLITSAEPGQPITFIGTGFAPHSTVVISIYSTATVLGTTVTDDKGDFSKPITVPPDLHVGGHVATAQGVAPDGLPRAMNLDIQVVPVGTGASGGGSGPGGSGTNGGSGRLPVTGAPVTLLLLLGLTSVLAGAALTASGRLRRW